jgi:uncharacterized membrane protein HdeD (DUF308 family)
LLCSACNAPHADVASVQERPVRKVSGIADLILAGLIIAGWPGSVAWALGLLIGINLFMSGLALVMTAIACRSVGDAPERAAPVSRTI